MKNFTIGLLVLCVTFSAVAQEKEKNHKIFKFNPLQLVTSSLSFSNEYFNAERNRSNVFTLGLRYKADDNNNSRTYNSTGEFIDNSSTWKGLTGSYERRIYIPAFRDGKANLLNAESSQYGVYLAPGLRLDLTNNDFDYGYFDTKFDNGQIVSEDKIISSGQRMTLGVMPFINLGIQFSIFQYGYVDLHVGGGLRVNNDFRNDRLSNNANNYYGSSDIINNLVLSQGVLPSGGVSLGVKI